MSNIVAFFQTKGQRQPARNLETRAEQFLRSPALRLSQLDKSFRQPRDIFLRGVHFLASVETNDEAPTAQIGFAHGEASRSKRPVHLRPIRSSGLAGFGQ